MHLTPLALEAYVAGVRPQAVDRHVRVCCACAQRLAASVVASARWERRGPLQRLVRVEEPQTLDSALDELLSEYRDAA